MLITGFADPKAKKLKDNLTDFWDFLFTERPVDDQIVAFYAACFMVSSAAIHRRSLHFYENLKSHLVANLPESGFCLERLWQSIFQMSYSDRWPSSVENEGNSAPMKVPPETLQQELSSAANDLKKQQNAIHEMREQLTRNAMRSTGKEL